MFNPVPSTSNHSFFCWRRNRFCQFRQLEDVPRCPHCGGPRVFECQARPVVWSRPPMRQQRLSEKNQVQPMLIAQLQGAAAKAGTVGIWIQGLNMNHYESISDDFCIISPNIIDISKLTGILVNLNFCCGTLFRHVFLSSPRGPLQERLDFGTICIYSCEVKRWCSTDAVLKWWIFQVNQWIHKNPNI